MIWGVIEYLEKGVFLVFCFIDFNDFFKIIIFS